MEIQAVQNRYFTLDEVLQGIPDESTETLPDIDGTYQAYLEELNEEIRTTDKLWLGFHAGQCEQFGHKGKSLLYRIVKSSVNNPKNQIAAANAIIILKVMGVSLSRLDLVNVHISDADLSGAVLDNSNLMGANLQRVNLGHASLNKCDLTKADLSEVDLEIIAQVNRYESEEYFFTSFNRYLVAYSDWRYFLLDFSNSTRTQILYPTISACTISPDEKYVFSFDSTHKELQIRELENVSVVCASIRISDIQSEDKRKYSLKMDQEGNSLFLISHLIFDHSQKDTIPLDILNTCIYQWRFDKKNANIQFQSYKKYSMPYEYSTIDISSKGSILIGSDNSFIEQKLYLLNVETDEYAEYSVGYNEEIIALASSPDEKYLIVFNGKTIEQFDLWNKKEERVDVRHISRTIILEEAGLSLMTPQFIPNSFMIVYHAPFMHSLCIRDLSKNSELISKIYEGSIGYKFIITRNGKNILGIGYDKLTLSKIINVSFSSEVVNQSDSIVSPEGMNIHILSRDESKIDSNITICASYNVHTGICTLKYLKRPFLESDIYNYSESRFVNSRYICNIYYYSSEKLLSPHTLDKRYDWDRKMLQIVDIMNPAIPPKHFSIEKLHSILFSDDGRWAIAIIRKKNVIKVYDLQDEIKKPLVFETEFVFPKTNFKMTLSKNFSIDKGYFAYSSGSLIYIYGPFYEMRVGFLS